MASETEESMLMPYEEVQGINNSSLVILEKRSTTIPVSTSLLGRVIDARGHPIDGKGKLDLESGEFEERGLYQKPSDPVTRSIIEKTHHTWNSFS